ncbi:hypothetical protein ACFL1T_02150 [Chlamydiota bacterium]
MKRRFLLSFLFSVLFSFVGHTATITVPDDYTEIQDAIDAAQYGDTVFIREGEYWTGSYVGPGYGALYLITLKEGVNLLGEGSDKTIIEHYGYGWGSYHGPKALGIYCSGNNTISELNIRATGYALVMDNQQGKIAIKNCIIDGIGFYESACIIEASTLEIKNNIFHGDTLFFGYNERQSMKIIQNIFIHFDYLHGGYRVGAHFEGKAYIRNNVFYTYNANSYSSYFAAYLRPVGNCKFINNICWSISLDPHPYAIPADIIVSDNSQEESASLYIDYCNFVTEGITNNSHVINILEGSHNISSDPQFIHIPYDLSEVYDFHLLQESPCIDTGSPHFLDKDGSRSDMGAYGGHKSIKTPNLNSAQLILEE